jgi:DNA-binding CsgD family transcriptional regulator
MRIGPALVDINAVPETVPPCVEEVTRALVELIEKARNQTGTEPPLTRSVEEEILVDTDLDDYRYLLIRMPRLKGNHVQLSPREQEIVRMVAKGHPNKVIADVLNISSWTVCTHLRRIFAKLGVGSRAAMVAQLGQLGALRPGHRGPIDAR